MVSIQQKGITEEVHMSDFEIQEIDLNDLLNGVTDNLKENISTFEDVIALEGGISREAYLYDINPGTGSAIDGFIRFWNNYDNKLGIPVEERKPIKLYIDSCGGSLTDTFTIIDSIKMSKTPVWTICIGCAYSGGFFSFIAGQKRIAYPHASFLFHEGSTQNGGTSSQFENYTQFYKKQLEQLKKVVLNNTNITEEEYKDIRKDDVWYDVEDGIAKGFIDEVAEELV
jgi:ATP-dependent Clp protease protease subunit